MKTNEQLQKDIQDAIKWEPMLHAAEIGITAQEGVVTLTGTVNSYAKKLEAESAVRKVIGVKALVEDIEVDFGNRDRKSDPDLANEVVAGLKLNWEVPKESIQVKVEDGGVTLTGEVAWNFQKEAAEACIAGLGGVRWVTNNIVVNPDSKDEVERRSIDSAICRHSSLDEDDILVTVAGNNVTLSGRVDSWYEKSEAERVAWKTAGVSSVKNELKIDYDLV